ncbi:uL30 family ribosomal protein [Candidatus Woesearchaeota archaeon]|nr:uL30 family ribosomal protein [Candidatus Woesearchaeota archaeon]
MLAIILIRGRERGTPAPIKGTLDLLKLLKKNNCVLFKSNPALQGMLQKVKDYVTWGELSDPTYKVLLEKRGKLFEGPLMDRHNKYSYNYSEINGQKYKSYFTLNPPRKGFGRKGIKVAFQAGGALGYRGEKINDLIERMV